MKHVRTARSYRSLSVDVEDGKRITVTGEPQKVSDEHAAKLEKAGQSVGVDVLVFDSEDEAAEGVVHQAARSGVAPDLSAGIAVITGTGDPVSSPGGVTPDGDEPDQAGQDAGGTSSAAAGSADQPNTPAVSTRSGKPASGTTTTEGN